MSKQDKLPWTRDSEASLLELVRQTRAMWDPRDGNYSKKTIKKKACEDIAESLRLEHPSLINLTADHVQQKFKNLRTYFIDLYRKLQRSPSGSEGKPGPKWPLFEFAMFLKDSMVDMSDSVSNFNISNTQDKSEPEVLATISLLPPDISTHDEDSNPSCSWDTEMPMFHNYNTSQSSPSSASPQPPSPQPPSPSAKVATNVERKNLKRAATNSPKTSKKCASEDEVDNYMKGLNDYLKKRQNKDGIAVSLGAFVEAAVEKMPFEKQIWFSQRLTSLVAEANNLPTE